MDKSKIESFIRKQSVHLFLSQGSHQIHWRYAEGHYGSADRPRDEKSDLAKRRHDVL